MDDPARAELGSVQSNYSLVEVTKVRVISSPEARHRSSDCNLRALPGGRGIEF
jgi:hypothetical protein